MSVWSWPSVPSSCAPVFTVFELSGKGPQNPSFWYLERGRAWRVEAEHPPSLLFLLMTLGPALVLLWAIDRRTPQLVRPALIFGKVPMFYFLLYIPLIHLIALAVFV